MTTSTNLLPDGNKWEQFAESFKQKIQNTQKDEITLLLPHYSINDPYKNEDVEDSSWAWDELSDYLGEYLFINDYDDLCADPHGLIQD